MQLLPLFGRQCGGYLNLNGHVLIPVYLRILHGYDSFAAKPYLLSRLGSCRNLADHIAVQGQEADLAAKHRCGKWDIGRGLDVHALPLISCPGRNVYLQQQITVLPASEARVSLAPEPHALAIVDACRNMHA